MYKTKYYASAGGIRHKCARQFFYFNKNTHNVLQTFEEFYLSVSLFFFQKPAARHHPQDVSSDSE